MIKEENKVFFVLIIFSFIPQFFCCHTIALENEIFKLKKKCYNVSLMVKAVAILFFD